MAITAKMIRTLAPAGSSINFMSLCGNSIFDYPCSITMIKTMLERGVKVYEQLAEPAEDGSTEIELTLENYAEDNGGIEIEDNADIIPDIELEVATAHAEEYEENMKNKGLNIKEQQTYTSNVFLGIINPLNPNIIIDIGGGSSAGGISSIDMGGYSSTGPSMVDGPTLEEGEEGSW